MTGRDLQVRALQDVAMSRLEAFSKAAEGAFAKNTERAFKADSAVWFSWCQKNGWPALPIEPQTLAAFIDDMGKVKRPATIARYLVSLRRMSRAAGQEIRTKDNEVELAIRRVRRASGVRQKQAKPLRDPDLSRITEVLDRSDARDLRDGVVLLLAYDTLCRRSEVVNLLWVDLQDRDDGTGIVLVRAGKTDQERAGKWRPVSRTTMEWVKLYRKAIETLGNCPPEILVSFDMSKRISGPLRCEGADQGGNVSRIIKRLVALSGQLPDGYSGHSLRVGATQDLTAAGFDLPAIMQAGGWSSPDMPARYAERLRAADSAMAELARRKGR